MAHHWMLKALALASYSKGTTSPNPTVGAVLIDRNGQYLGSAVTQPYGSDHAERGLLKNLSLSQTEGGTLFVTLEPCSFHGKTPPCADIIIEKKIQKVVISTLDPNPLIYGRGVSQLQSAGIDVQVGLYEKEAIAINRDFFYAIKNKMPFIFAKVGLSLDGFMATQTGKSQWITGARSRRMGHILRYRSDAILVGAGTATADNPQLTARPTNQRNKVLLRIILDGEASLSQELRVFSDNLPTLWVIREKWGHETKVQNVKERPHKEIFLLKKEGWPGLQSLLEYLYKEKKIISLMLEGGSKVFQTFLEHKLLQEVFLFYGGLLLGKGLSPFPMDVNELQEAPCVKVLQIKSLGGDFMIHGRLNV